MSSCPYLWLGKYAVQKILSAVPFGSALNTVFQRTIGGLRRPVIYGFPRTLTMLHLLSEQGIRLHDSVCVELGTGWDGSSALTLCRASVREVHSYDHVRHMAADLRKQAMEIVSNPTAHGSITDGFPDPLPWDKVAASLGDNTGEFHYHAPQDARFTGLPSDTVDFYYSLATLEHIPQTTLQGLLTESFRILKPDGYCYHYVQPKMHSGYGSTGVEYLQFSSRTWERWLGNSIAYENRLRAAQYVTLLQESGFEITSQRVTLNHNGMKQLKTMHVADEFRKFSLEQLAQDYLWVIARKPLSA